MIKTLEALFALILIIYIPSPTIAAERQWPGAAGTRPVISGIVADVTPATRQTPYGRVAFTFSIVEHVGTGSRATLETKPVAFEAQPSGPPADAQKKRSGRKASKVLVNAVVPAGTTFAAVTTGPLIVKIPK
jgi:hypothetical protein